VTNEANSARAAVDPGASTAEKEANEAKDAQTLPVLRTMPAKLSLVALAKRRERSHSSRRGPALSYGTGTTGRFRPTDKLAR